MLQTFWEIQQCCKLQMLQKKNLCLPYDIRRPLFWHFWLQVICYAVPIGFFFCNIWRLQHCYISQNVCNMAFATILFSPKSLQHCSLQHIQNFQNVLQHFFATIMLQKCLFTIFLPMWKRRLIS